MNPHSSHPATGVNNIFNFLGNTKDKESAKLVDNIKKAFKAVKTELDDHLEAVNQNTDDIQEVHSILTELDAKINKLSERIDELGCIIAPKKPKKLDVKLTPREQEVFMALYVGKGLTLTGMGKQLSFTTDMINMYLFNLISKGIPIQKELVDDVLVFSLDSEFKELQARRNVLEIDPRIAKQMASQDI
ncbi:MAG: hypothetical protein V1866_04250 [archaeon]